MQGPVTAFELQKGPLKIQRALPLKLLTGTPRIGGGLRLRGSIRPASISFEAEICGDVKVHDESTDRTNDDSDDS